ncbi:MAG TPA: hydratase [Rheinheimera sp.]|nr:hydratase [Rheinheimera sp.]
MSTQPDAFWLQTLAHRRAHGVMADLPAAVGRPQSSDEAFALQQQFAAGYGEVIGWKCGVPGLTDAGLPKWVVAPLYQRELQQGAECALWPSVKGLARVEPEYAYPLLADLPAFTALSHADAPVSADLSTDKDQSDEHSFDHSAEHSVDQSADLSHAAIDALLGTPKLAFELIQSRFAADAGAQFFDQLADGLFNQGVWLGPTLSQGEHAEFPLTVMITDQPPQQLAARHPNLAPRLPIYWLVNFLRRHGVALKAGQHLITGSFAGVIELPFNHGVQWQFGSEPAFSLVYRNKAEL